MGGLVRRGSLTFGYVIPAPLLGRLVRNGGRILGLNCSSSTEECKAVRQWYQSFGAALAGKPISTAAWSHISSKISSPFGNAFIWSSSSLCSAF
ncbi:unnamed protein product [Brassica rapa]|uniref:Uncharacterized protein n=2 Tax=Brassica TaxID=3705 RepID=A0A8D9MEL1_BRACM|nr:unnamed protein product [Brassica napus]CAG7907407.1 unnamed protein product [Brassica rapa]